MADKFCLKMPKFHVTFSDLLHAVNLRHGIEGFTSPPKEGMLRIFSLWKIRRLRSGLNPRTWVPKASTLPLDHRSRYESDFVECIWKKDLRLWKKQNFLLQENGEPRTGIMILAEISWPAVEHTPPRVPVMFAHLQCLNMRNIIRNLALTHIVTSYDYYNPTHGVRKQPNAVLSNLLQHRPIWILQPQPVTFSGEMYFILHNKGFKITTT